MRRGDPENIEFIMITGLLCRLRLRAMTVFCLCHHEERMRRGDPKNIEFIMITGLLCRLWLGAMTVFCLCHHEERMRRGDLENIEFIMDYWIALSPLAPRNDGGRLLSL